MDRHRAETPVVRRFKLSAISLQAISFQLSAISFLVLIVDC